MCDNDDGCILKSKKSAKENKTRSKKIMNEIKK